MGIKNKSTFKYIQIILTQKFDQVTICFNSMKTPLHFPEIAITHAPTQ